MSSPSINTKIIEPLIKLNIDLEVIYLVNKVNHIYNPRSGDYGLIKEVPLNIFNLEERFEMKKTELINQNIFDLVKRSKDVHNDDYRSYENLLCQLGMLKEATRKKNFLSFDRVIMIRDDLVIQSSFNMKSLLQISKHGPITSMWHWHGGIGERFCISSPKIAFKLANRLDCVIDFVNRYGYLNGEHLQKYVMDKEGESVFAFNLKLSRSRLNFVLKEKFYLPLWRPYEIYRVFLAVTRYTYRCFYYTCLSYKLFRR